MTMSLVQSELHRFWPPNSYFGYLRLFDFILAIFMIILLWMNNHPIRKKLSWPEALSRVSFAGMAFAAAYGVLESHTLDIPGGTRTFILSGALILGDFALSTMVWQRYKKKRSRRHGITSSSGPAG